MKNGRRRRRWKYSYTNINSKEEEKEMWEIKTERGKERVSTEDSKTILENVSIIAVLKA